MKQLALVALFGLAVGANAQTAFYGGDFDGNNGLAAQVNGPNFTDVVLYDNFSLSSLTTITAVFANVQDSGTQRGGSLYWEIRTGMSGGNGGTLVAGGVSNAATTVATGNTPFGTVEYKYEAAVANFNLAAGNYWLGIAVNGGDGNCYVSTTTGTNGVGGPLNDGNSFLNSPSFAINYENANDFIGNANGNVDFSMGLRGHAPVPEPASMAALGLGALAMIRRRRSK